MADFTLRETRAEDHAPLAMLWKSSFGDPPRLIENFFRLLPELGRGVTALYQGRCVGAAYALTGLRLVTGQGAEKSCGYIYAVAVEETCRGMGMGGALSAAAAESARKAGAEIICTLPAEDSLYGWYEKLIGVKCALRRTARQVKACAGAKCLPISAAEYGDIRETLLRGKAHIDFPKAYLEFQRELCAQYGGGFYKLRGGIAAAYGEGDSALIRELVLPDGADRDSAAAALAGELGMEWALCYGPDPNGEKFMVADSPLPPDCQWNLALD